MVTLPGDTAVLSMTARVTIAAANPRVAAKPNKWTRRILRDEPSFMFRSLPIERAPAIRSRPGAIKITVYQRRTPAGEGPRSHLDHQARTGGMSGPLMPSCQGQIRRRQR